MSYVGICMAIRYTHAVYRNDDGLLAVCHCLKISHMKQHRRSKVAVELRLQFGIDMNFVTDPMKQKREEWIAWMANTKANKRHIYNGIKYKCTRSRMNGARKNPHRTSVSLLSHNKIDQHLNTGCVRVAVAVGRLLLILFIFVSLFLLL